jgi:pimeloyl-ACP methyl ester carboxylesterase
MVLALALACARTEAAVTETRLTCPAPDRPLAASVIAGPGVGPRPGAVVLVGAQGWDRYGDLPDGPKWVHYRDVAEAIAGAGGVALLFDKGGTGETGGPPAGATQRVREAVAAAACLRSRPEVDPARVWLVGHSQGAMVAVRAAPEAKPAGLALLSPIASEAPAGLPFVVVRGTADGGEATDAGLLAGRPDARRVLVEGGDHLLMVGGSARISEVATRAVAEAVTGRD